MKRIYLVGASKDGKRLHLAQKQGAKFPSMELSLSPKVRTVLRELEAQRLARRGKKLPADELEEARRTAGAAESRAKQAGARAQKAWEQQRDAEDRLRDAERKLHEAEERARQAERRAQLAERGAMVDAARAEGPPGDVVPPRGFEAVGEETEGVRAMVPSSSQEHASSEEPSGEEQPQEVTEAPEQRERRDLAPDSKLSPAEIQALLRAGRGIRSVAKQAGVPIDWVRRLAAPIESERLGTVTQLLRSYVVRSRLGRSAMPIGPSIVENLREKGVRFPEKIVEEGWTAWRPDGREWRVRFVYESRGRNQRADWRFDPQTREVTPQNQLAQELGFRSPEGGRMNRQTAEVNAAAIRPRRISGSRSSSSSGGRQGSSKGSAKRSSSSKGSGKRSSRSKGSSSRSRRSRR